MTRYADDYDWKQAFEYASFDISDIDHVIADDEGANDGPTWISYGQLKDGRFYFLAAGCDYTGWDCQAYGDCYVEEDDDIIERFRMSDRERARLWINIEPLPGPKPIEDIDD